MVNTIPLIVMKAADVHYKQKGGGVTILNSTNTLGLCPAG